MNDPERAIQYRALWQSALIGATGVMLLLKVLNGTLAFYVHTRYTPLIFGTGGLLVVLALLHGWFTLRPRSAGDHHAHEHGQAPRSWRSAATLALLLPVLLGLLVPSRALGTSAISTRGFGTGGGMRTIQSVAEGEGAAGLPDPAAWTMLDWVSALTYEPNNPH
ncbi:MAG: DUF1980 domain-containing protein, partial [Ardenticatenaceae bacterium]